MDALSSMANIAGYRAVVEAASFYGRFFTGQMTAAGRVPPAKVLVIGAGVAGLSAIGAARGMGAIVRAFDTRPTVKEQVKSMGAEFIELNVAEDGEGAGGYAKEMSPAFIKAEMEMFAAQAKDVDIIITTALIPNRPAPILITEEMVKSMKNGSVIVDLAAENGGNCALTEPGQVVERHGVHILGYTDLPSRLAPTASLLFGNNLTHLLADLGGASHFHLDLADEVVRGALVLRDGELLWPPPARPPVALPPDPKVAAKPAPCRTRPRRRRRRGIAGPILAIAGAIALVGLGLRRATRVPVAPDGVRAGVHRRLAGGVERHAGAAHAADERDQRDQRHHRDRRHAAGERTAVFDHHHPRRRRDPAGDDQHRRRLPRHAAHAAHVPPLARACLRPSSPIAYLGAGLLFIFSLAGLSAQESARRGNLFGMAGMLIAVLVTAFGPRVDSYTVLTGALVVGGAIGATLASRVEMTSMPQLVAILHSFVGAAAVLVGIATALDHSAGALRRRSAHSRDRDLRRRVRRRGHVHRIGRSPTASCRD